MKTHFSKTVQVNLSTCTAFRRKKLIKRLAQYVLGLQVDAGLLVEDIADVIYQVEGNGVAVCQNSNFCAGPVHGGDAHYNVNAQSIQSIIHYRSFGFSKFQRCHTSNAFEHIIEVLWVSISGFRFSYLFSLIGSVQP